MPIDLHVTEGTRVRASAALGKSVFLLVFLSVLTGFAFASTPSQRDWWYTLQRGQLMFIRGDYGNALLAFEDARRDRIAVIDRMERDLIDVLSLPEVRRLGDSLEWVERFIRERHFTAAAAALDELFFRVPRESFGNSALAALEELGNLRGFPEAEMWIGRTFLAGGELGIALIQFERALASRHLLENPALATDIMYQIAEIHRLRGEFHAMERVLHSILEDSVLWAGAGIGWQAGTFARDAMTRTLQSDGAERMIVLYRYGDTRVLRAHRELGFHYAALGRHARAQEHLMFAFVIQNTVIIDEILRRRHDFTFTTLAALAGEIARDRMLSAYADETEYFRVAFYLANSLHGNGHPARARELWGFLAERPDAGEWQARAASQLRAPRVGATLVLQP